MRSAALDPNRTRLADFALMSLYLLVPPKIDGISRQLRLFHAPIYN
jgi:hypothetical protein